MINLVMYHFVCYRRILLQLVLILLYMTRKKSKYTVYDSQKVLLEVPLQGNMDFCLVLSALCSLQYY